MTYVDVVFSDLRLRARLLDERAPAATSALWNALPLEGRAFQDRYSSQVMRMTTRLEVDTAKDRYYGYQQPGLLMFDPTSWELALCFVNLMHEVDQPRGPHNSSSRFAKRNKMRERFDFPAQAGTVL